MQKTLGKREAVTGRLMVAVISSCALLLGGTAAGAAPVEDAAPTVVRSLPLPGTETRSHDPVLVAASETCPPLPRSTEDRPDIVSGPSIHVVYLIAADSPDQLLDSSGTLSCTIRAQNRWMEEQSGSRWNFDVFRVPAGRRRPATTAIDVTFARSTRPAAELGGATQVRDELIKLGFAQPGKRYLSYVMGQYTTFCGDAIYPVSTRPDEQVDGIYAQVYLSSTNSCNAHWFGTPGNPSWSDAIAQQELLHTEGLAAMGAPHSCPMILPFAHICTGALFYTEESLELDPERIDLMYPYVTLPLGEKVLDRGHDDYFDHGLPLADLAESPYLISPP